MAYLCVGGQEDTGATSQGILAHSSNSRVQGSWVASPFLTKTRGDMVKGNDLRSVSVEMRRGSKSEGLERSEPPERKDHLLDIRGQRAVCLL